LQDLLKLIANGIEFPDASWKISQKHKVSCEVLQKAYDAHPDPIDLNAISAWETRLRKYEHPIRAFPLLGGVAAKRH